MFAAHSAPTWSWQVSAVADGFRLRVCFRKTGRLRHLSHLETVHACERSARRARLPYAVSQGFTPRMKMSFGPALPVGTAGEREYYDLLMTAFVPPEEVYDALRRVSVEDIGPRQCAYVGPKAPSLGAELTIASYEVMMEGGIPPEEIERSLASVVGTGTLAVQHKGKSKVFDLAEALPKEPEVASQEGRTMVRVWVRMGDRGSLRPEALISAATGPAARMQVTRTDLLIDDQGAWRRPL